jgi:hypothetical protein
MDIPRGWHETKLPPNPDVKKLRSFLGTWYQKSGLEDEENFAIQRRGQDRWFLISRESIKQVRLLLRVMEEWLLTEAKEEIRKAATRGIKLDPISDSAENSSPGTRDPNATSQARARPTSPAITIDSSAPTRPDDARPKSAPSANHPAGYKPLEKSATMKAISRVASNTWSMLRGLVDLRNYTEKRINK